MIIKRITFKNLLNLINIIFNVNYIKFKTSINTNLIVKFSGKQTPKQTLFPLRFTPKIPGNNFFMLLLSEVIQKNLINVMYEGFSPILKTRPCRKILGFTAFH